MMWQEGNNTSLPSRRWRSELVEYLIDPEALETGQRLVEAVEFVIAQATNLVDRRAL